MLPLPPAPDADPAAAPSPLPAALSSLGSRVPAAAAQRCASNRSCSMCAAAGDSSSNAAESTAAASRIVLAKLPAWRPMRCRMALALSTRGAPPTSKRNTCRWISYRPWRWALPRSDGVLASYTDCCPIGAVRWLGQGGTRAQGRPRAGGLQADFPHMPPNPRGTLHTG